MEFILANAGDGLGSVAALSKLNGSTVEIAEQYRYDAFGITKVLDGSGTEITDPANFLGNPYMFTGRRLDPETRSGLRNGLYYYRARMYYPELGRFMQTDPIGYYDSMNLYQYCGNNPVNWIDPWGEFIFFFGFQEVAYPLEPVYAPRPVVLPRVIAPRIVYPSSLESIPAPPIVGPTGEPLSPPNDKCPEQRKGGGKNDKHGKSEDSPAQKKQLEDIEKQLEQKLPRRTRKKLEAKRDRIKKDMARRRKGENHSQKPKGPTRTGTPYRIRRDGLGRPMWD